MKKIFVVEFGGTPSRTELCLLMNCGAGLYSDMDFTIYPLDKDIKSPNYVNSRDFCKDYQKVHRLTADGMFATSGVIRREDLFEEVLKLAGIGKNRETIRNLVSDNGSLGAKGHMLLNLCFTEKEQYMDVEGGYYGRADIGAVTSRYLVHRKVYDSMGLVTDIERVLNEGGSGLDVVILCSSFGGTGASLGINFGEYLAERYRAQRNRLHLHCIHIQPYFSFPDPDDKDNWKIDCHEFYAKSASVVTAYGNKENFIRTVSEEEKNNPDTSTGKNDYIFDSFYYLGQEVLDNVSDKNAARDEQQNDLHMIDMLVGMAIEDAVSRTRTDVGLQLYSYLYSREGTGFLTWEHMKDSVRFKERHISFARFCAFVLHVLKPLLDLEKEQYEAESLIVHMYGPVRKISFSQRAKVRQDVDDKFRGALGPVFNFCRNYLIYWDQIESTTRHGGQDASITRFFNKREINRILNEKVSLEEGRERLHLEHLANSRGSKSYSAALSGGDVYDQLCKSNTLKLAAGEGKSGEAAASVLLQEIYRQCRLHMEE